MPHIISNSRPLKGLRILVTRSRHQAGQLTERLKILGASVIEVPVISIQPPASWDDFDIAINNIQEHTYNWLIFASVNAVEFSLARIKETKDNWDILSQIKIAAIGPATTAALKHRGLEPAFCPSQFVGEKLVDEFPGYPTLDGTRIIWPRTNIGNPYVADKLRLAGAMVNTVECYRTSLPEDSDQIAEQLASLLINHEIDLITLASSQTARNLTELLSIGLKQQKAFKHQDALLQLLDSIAIASIGPETSETAGEYLHKVDIEAAKYTIDGLVTAIVEHIQKPSY